MFDTVKYLSREEVIEISGGIFNNIGPYDHFVFLAEPRYIGSTSRESFFESLKKRSVEVLGYEPFLLEGDVRIIRDSFDNRFEPSLIMIGVASKSDAMQLRLIFG